MLREEEMSAQWTTPPKEPREFYVVHTWEKGVKYVKIKEVLIGESIGVAQETPAETATVLKNVKNPPPEGMYSGTLESLKRYITTYRPPEKQILEIMWATIRKRLQELFS